MALNMQWLNKLWQRRDRDRLEHRLEASILVLDGEGGTGLTSVQPARVLNLSEGGCCLALNSLALEGFHLDRCLDAPRDFPLEVAITAPNGGTWRLLAQVCWTNQDQDGPQPGQYRVGARFGGAQGLPQNWRRLLSAPAGPGTLHETSSRSLS
ncbi:MAG: PilZ domain-containing protein [Pseudomonadota bacterium]